MRQAIEELIDVGAAIFRITFVAVCVVVTGLAVYGFVAFFVKEALR